MDPLIRLTPPLPGQGCFSEGRLTWVGPFIKPGARRFHVSANLLVMVADGSGRDAHSR